MLTQMPPSRELALEIAGIELMPPDVPRGHGCGRLLLFRAVRFEQEEHGATGIRGDGETAHISSTIPIVFTSGADPLGVGLVERLNRPGGHMTGVTSFDTVIAARRLELLRKLTPDAAVIALLRNPSQAALCVRVVFFRQ
jgi:hypothetical protein